jgi:glycerophosphoryl diester phosphodiesterase
MESYDGLPADRVWVIAHRGYAARYPENTLVAFDAALQGGADAIETDVRLTADGFAVLLHDDTVDRTTNGRGRVNALAVREIERLDAGGWFAPAHRNQRVPVLETLLARYGERTVLNLELKPDPSAGVAHAIALANEVVRLVHKFRVEPGVVVSSFDHGLLAHVKRVAPAVPVALLYERLPPWETVLAEAASLQARWVAPAAGWLLRHGLDALGQGGMAVVPYTVDDAPNMRRLLAAGVRGLFTNEVELLRDMLEAAS